MYAKSIPKKHLNILLYGSEDFDCNMNKEILIYFSYIYEK